METFEVNRSCPNTHHSQGKGSGDISELCRVITMFSCFVQANQIAGLCYPGSCHHSHPHPTHTMTTEDQIIPFGNSLQLVHDSTHNKDSIQMLPDPPLPLPTHGGWVCELQHSWEYGQHFKYMQSHMQLCPAGRPYWTMGVTSLKMYMYMHPYWRGSASQRGIKALLGRCLSELQSSEHID